jgi:hypothetical protein
MIVGLFNVGLSTEEVMNIVKISNHATCCFLFDLLVVTSVIWYMGTNILEQHTACIFYPRLLGGYIIPSVGTHVQGTQYHNPGSLKLYHHPLENFESYICSVLS